MGLDMYAYVAARESQYNDYWNSVEWDNETMTHVNDKVTKPLEIAYWRKHPNLHGWFEALYRDRGGEGDFNGDELELTFEDIDRLEADLTAGSLPETTGFFFGDPSDDYYREADLEFIKAARTHLFLGLKVFYNSSW
jgi:hypothetical protein